GLGSIRWIGDRRRFLHRSRIHDDRGQFLHRGCALYWQPHGETRALALLAFDLDAAAVHVDRHLDEVEPDAGSDNSRHVAAAVIALEQPIEVGPGNADAVVGNGDDDRIRGNAGIDVDRAAAWRVLDGVGKEIAENLKQQLGIADHTYRRGSNPLGDLRPRHHLPVQLADLF